MRQLAALSVALFIAFNVCAEDEGFADITPKDDLKGWKVSYEYDTSIPPKLEGKAWGVENGVLKGLSKKSWIFTEEEYGDFTLKFDWKINAKGNSGVGIRMPGKGNPSFLGMEIQMVDLAYRAGMTPVQVTGAIYAELAASKDATKPAGEWNTYEITAKGKQLTVLLNGEKIIDTDLSKHTKSHDPQYPALSERPVKGHIGFQDISGEPQIRNIKIKKL